MNPESSTQTSMNYGPSAWKTSELCSCVYARDCPMVNISQVENDEFQAIQPFGFASTSVSLILCFASLVVNVTLMVVIHRLRKELPCKVHILMQTMALAHIAISLVLFVGCIYTLAELSQGQWFSGASLLVLQSFRTGLTLHCITTAIFLMLFWSPVVDYFMICMLALVAAKWPLYYRNAITCGRFKLALWLNAILTIGLGGIGYGMFLMAETVTPCNSSTETLCFSHSQYYYGNMMYPFALFYLILTGLLLTGLLTCYFLTRKAILIQCFQMRGSKHSRQPRAEKKVMTRLGFNIAIYAICLFVSIVDWIAVFWLITDEQRRLVTLFLDSKPEFEPGFRNASETVCHLLHQKALIHREYDIKLVPIFLVESCLLARMILEPAFHLYTNPTLNKYLRKVIVRKNSKKSLRSGSGSSTF